MLTSYIKAAMGHAIYEQLADGSLVGRIPGLDGVWANADTPRACRRELREVLEEWIMISLACRLPIPPIDGIELAVREVA
jgi:predicted RNase H-like HicB family nuclease